jgi:hypothetical protein
MNIARNQLFRGALLVTLIGSIVYLTYGKEGIVPILRNVAWNDLLTRIRLLPEDSPQDSLGRELSVIQQFLKGTRRRREAISTMSKCSGPLTKHAPVYRKAIEIWKLYEMNCPTGKSKQSSGSDS